jgi:hypothetical protein
MNTEQHILQKNLAQFLIKDVFNTITEDDILKIKSPEIWYCKGKELTPGQVKALRSEADSFYNSGLWKILRSELLWHAHQNGYVKSKTEADQIAGKLLEYLTNVVDSKLKIMSQTNQ